MGAPVKKLLNFFERFHEACKGKKHHHKLIDIMQEVLVCDNEDEVFAVYPMILNQVKFAFDFLENNTRQNAESLEKVRSHMENCVNQSRASLYKTLSENNQDPKKYPIYLDHNIFELFKSFANGLPDEEEDIAKEDVNNLIKEIEDLKNSLTYKKIIFGDKLYLQNLLKRIILTLRNYDKFSLSDELIGDSLSLFYNVSTNDELNKDSNFFDKAKNICGKIFNKVKPDKVRLELNFNSMGVIGSKISLDWKNKDDN
ncbi:hypothetical protein LBMAG18_12820 [Alphaproteobacteria bacterium]|nr:hypothetical protein LBMAG18_12820 [Alphaproteobacteria bacterium]